jgi:hypothetical protein
MKNEMMNKQIAYQNSMQLLNNPQILQSKINDLIKSHHRGQKG